MTKRIKLLRAILAHMHKELRENMGQWDVTRVSLQVTRMATIKNRLPHIKPAPPRIASQRKLPLTF